MSSNITLKATGIYTQPNQLDLQPGALVAADNVVIDRDNIIEKRRGFKLYSNAIGLGTDRMKQLMQYRNQLITHYSNSLAYDNGSGTFTNFPGSFTEQAPGVRIKSVVANNNFYFTTSNGVEKLSATTSDLSQGVLSQAGGIKAVDLTGVVNYIYGNAGGFLPQDSAVAYRTVWGITDPNKNLILGTPSSPLQVYNPLLPSLLKDFAVLLRQLDSAVSDSPANLGYSDLSTYSQHFYLPSTSPVTSLYTNIIGLSSALDTNLYGYTSHNLTNAVYSSITNTIDFTVSSSGTGFTNSLGISPGDSIRVTSSNPSTFNGTYTVLSINSTTGVIHVSLPDNGTNPGTWVSGGTLQKVVFATLTQPDVPSIPTTDSQLVALQTYMTSIQGKLQGYVNIPTTYQMSSFSSVPDGPQFDVTMNFASSTYFFPGQALFTHFNNFSQVAYVTSTSGEGTTVVVKTSTAPTGAAGVNTYAYSNVITPSAATAYFTTLSSTVSADVTLTITVPQGVISAGVGEYFLQVYRSTIDQATGTTVLSETAPNDEMKLVYEAFPTQAELNAGYMVVTDNTPDSLAGAFLYTNENSGEGILQANETPPYALDMNIYKNVTFYANTRLKHSLTMTLVGLSKMISDLNSSISPMITIGDAEQSVTYKFVLGVQQVAHFTLTVAAPANYSYFDLFDTDGTTHRFYFYDVTTTFVDPGFSASLNPVRIDFNPNDLNFLMNQIIMSINTVSDVFTATNSDSTHFTVTNTKFGTATNPSIHTGILTLTSVTPGVGQSTTTTPKQILLVNQTSVSQSIDQTARSLVNVINSDPTSPVYAFYLASSTAANTIGEFELESRTLNSDPFYVIANNSNTGSSFNPTISPTSTITSITPGNPTTVTSTAHGLVNGDTIIVSSSNSPTSIDGVYSVTITGANTFTIPIDTHLMAPGSYTAVYSKTAVAESSDDNARVNRIFYSKYQQPEAVPLVNFLDVGDSDKPIIRIFPLRDSLFIFKEEGLYRISGEVSPFSLSLFDTSCRLIASDSLGVTANVIFGFTKKGIETVSESGASLISRPIEDKLLKLSSYTYTNFSTATWGIGYDSDKSYLVFTVNKTIDTVSTICYRYNTVTAAWTVYRKTNTCGIVKLQDDRLYLGAGDVDFIEQERKSYSREDYADREFTDQLGFGSYLGNQLKLTLVGNYAVGDAVTQTQLLTIYTYNQLLVKLFNDLGYTSLQSLTLSGGANMRIAVENLATALNATGQNYSGLIASGTGSIGSQTIGGSAVHITSTAHGLHTGRYVVIGGNTSTPSLNGTWQVTVIDANTFSIPTTVITSSSTGTWTTNDSSFADTAACYNLIIDELNTDPAVHYRNYSHTRDNATFETIITDINYISGLLTVDETLPYTIGPITIYKSIDSFVQYGPLTMGDPLSIKHFREATYMFQNKAFTDAIASFSSDMLPGLNPITFKGDGNGIYGNNTYGSGFYGGSSNGAPFRTYIPRNNQRCRYLNVIFEHSIARESPILYGVTITGENTGSTRGYRN